MSWPWLAFIWDSPVNIYIYIHYIYILIYIYLYRYAVCICVHMCSSQRYVSAICTRTHILLYCNFTRMIIRPGSIVRLTNICALITYTFTKLRSSLWKRLSVSCFLIFFFPHFVSSLLFPLSFFLSFSCVLSFLTLFSHMSFKSGCILHIS